MLRIPLQQVPNQTLRASLGGLDCQILISQRERGVFVSVSASGLGDVASNALALTGVGIIDNELTGFIGQLVFIDTLADEDPDFSSFDDRFILMYLSGAENEQFRK